jgi:Cdc6-like AAA superfamily ATPase
MNSETTTPAFNLLSIGQRGVGKTVFLAGSYTELHADSRTKYNVLLVHPDRSYIQCCHPQTYRCSSATVVAGVEVEPTLPYQWVAKSQEFDCSLVV